MTRMVEKRASTVEDATAAALAELGVTRDEATIEVLSEGRRGLFSGRSRAHVRVTARDGQNGQDPPPAPVVDGAPSTSERQDDAQRLGDQTSPAQTDDTSPSDVDETDADEAPAPTDRLAELNQEADLAADFIEGLLDILELPGDIEIEVDENQAFVNVVEVGSGLLIGRRGATLDALQELVRAATQRQVERRSHVRIDIEGYRQRQLEKMKDRCRDGIAQVRETGEPFRLEPMDAYERKVMHDLVTRTGGVTSSSEGVEPRRRVVVYAVEE